MKTIILVSLGAILLLGTIMYFSASNKEVTLRSKIKAQSEACEAYYDKLWKVISQKAQVTDEYKEAFKEIYPQLMEGRYGNERGGSLMSWIQESNPTFDVSLYKDLMHSIEGERAGFFMEQRKLIDLNNEHRIARKTFPGSLFIGNRSDIDIVIVTSSITKQVFETGKDDDIELFKRKK